MKTFKEKYWLGHHPFAVGHNHISIRDLFREIYFDIEIYIKSWYNWEEQKWNINTCETVYQCPKCKKGGMIMEKIINLAEDKGGKIEGETMYCSNSNDCNNSWEVSITLTRLF